MDKTSTPKEVHAVRFLHNVDRWGRITDPALSVLTPDETDTQVLALDKDTPVEDIFSLSDMDIATSIEVILSRVEKYKNGDAEYYLPISTSLPYSSKGGKCQYCKSSFRESLGILYCNNDECPQRLYSRLEYFVVHSGCQIEYNQLFDLKEMIFGMAGSFTLYPKVFIDLILPDYKTQYGVGFYDNDTKLYMEMFYNQVTKWLYYYPGVESYMSSLIKFICDLSIPGLSAKDIYRVADDAAQIREHSHLFALLSRTLWAKGGGNDRDDGIYSSYVKELQELSARLHQYTVQ